MRPSVLRDQIWSALKRRRSSGMRLGELVEALGASPFGIRYHLVALQARGLVRQRGRGASSRWWAAAAT